jgi:DNA-binding MarR family transcriptional regulator
MPCGTLRSLTARFKAPPAGALAYSQACGQVKHQFSAFLPYQLAVASSRISKGFADRYRAEFGLSIPEWRVLAHLAQATSVSVREIHARVDMDKSKVSRAAARLEIQGLIEKRENPEDRRLLDMRLTPKGQELIARIVPIADAYQAQIMAQLGVDGPAFASGLLKLTEGK